MKNPVLTRFLLSIFSLLAQLIMSGTSIGCAWLYEAEDDHYGSLFAPELIGEPVNTPLFLSDHETYNYSWDGPVGGPTPSQLEAEVNVKEWARFMGNRCSTGELTNLIYHTDTTQCEALLKYAMGEAPMPADTALNTLAVLLKSAPTGRQLLQYLVLAKQCEAVATASLVIVEWEDRYELDTLMRQRQQQLLGLLANATAQSTEPFLTQRYVFQSIRMNYFTGAYAQGIEVFNRNERLLQAESNSIYYKALSYVAGCYYKQKQFAKANSLFARVFDAYPPMRVSSWQSFHPQEQSDWEGCLAMATTTHEKCVLWQLFGLYADPMIAMRAINALDPAAPELNLLLVRAVNAAERNVMFRKDPDLLGEERERIREQLDWEDPDNKQPFPFLGYLKGSSFGSELRLLVAGIADKGKSAKPDLWNLSAGYLYFLENNFPGARTYLNRVSESAETTVKQQKQLILILIRLMEKETIDAAYEAQLLQDLRFLESLKEPLRFENAIYECYYQLSLKYKAQGLEERALLAANDRALDERQLSLLMHFMLASNHTEFEKVLIKQYRYSLFDFYNYRGTALLYRYDFTGAAAAFTHALAYGKRSRLEILGDPFLIHIVDDHDLDHENSPKVKYTKLDFVNKMRKLMQLAETDKAKAASYYFLVANGFYNMTVYGNARLLAETHITNSQDFWMEDGLRLSVPAELPAYTRCDKAEAYYLKAKLSSQSREFGAKCTFMASKCELVRFYESGNYMADSVDFRAGRHFNTLYNQFAGTAYYRDIINECGYFATFVKQAQQRKH